MGELIGIAMRPGKRTPMRVVQRATIREADGLVGDYGGTDEARQVTVMAKEDWEAACRDLGANLHWTKRRANLLIKNLALPEKSGCYLQIGEVILKIAGRTEPCERLESTYKGLRKVLSIGGRGGVFCRVIKGGIVGMGDDVQVLKELPETE